MDSRQKYFRERDKRNYTLNIKNNILRIEVKTSILFVSRLHGIDHMLNKFFDERNIEYGQIAYQRNQLTWSNEWVVELKGEEAFVLILKDDIFKDELIEYMQDCIEMTTAQLLERG